MTIFIPQPLSARKPVAPQTGFSLIELMVVVAIISILGMIVLPQYQRFAAKAKLAAALSELAVGKIGAEILVNENFKGGPLTPEDLGLPSQGSQCERFDVSGVQGSFHLICHLKRDRAYGGGALILHRTESTSSWHCQAYVGDENLLPKDCRRS